MNKQEHIELDEDVRLTAERIDDVAERMRDEPSAGFEDRLFMATRRTGPAVRTVRFVTPMRIAAVVAVATGAVALMTLVPDRAPIGQIELASLEAEFDEWFELTSAFDNGLSLELDAAATEASILSSQDLAEFFDEENL